MDTSTSSRSTGLDALDTRTVQRMALSNTFSLLLGGVAMARWERKMRASGGPGIFELQLARDANEAADVLESWGPVGRRAAVEETWADFAWMITYGIAGVCAGELARRRAAPGSGWESVGRVVRWAPAGAVACDVAEGVGLLRTLKDWPRVEEGRVAWTRAAAATKYALLVGTAVWAAGAATVGGRRR